MIWEHAASSIRSIHAQHEVVNREETVIHPFGGAAASSTGINVVELATVDTLTSIYRATLTQWRNRGLRIQSSNWQIIARLIIKQPKIKTHNKKVPWAPAALATSYQNSRADAQRVTGEGKVHHQIVARLARSTTVRMEYYVNLLRSRIDWKSTQTNATDKQLSSTWNVKPWGSISFSAWATLSDSHGVLRSTYSIPASRSTNRLATAPAENRGSTGASCVIYLGSSVAGLRRIRLPR